MRSSHLTVSLLMLFIFLSGVQVQGIRLEKTFRLAGHHMQELSATALMKISKGVMKDIILCKQGHCSTGMGRKLFSTATEDKANPISTRKSAVNEENVGKQEKFHDQHVDIMDYSPARRKTPIHN